jgi:putative methyltransferase (TIGR04325 family)
MKWSAQTGLKVKDAIKSFVPSIFVSAYRKIVPRRVWEGVFTSFQEVVIEGEGLDGDTWADIVEYETRSAQKALADGGMIPDLLRGDNLLLPLLVSVLACEKQEIRILDLGGGAGVDYLHLRIAASGLTNYEYHVVESEKICGKGRLIHGSDSRITFHVSLPDPGRSFDIVHMDSVLQYIENYPSLLSTLCRYKPRFFIFVRLPAGEVPSYVSKQVNVAGVTCAHRFFNTVELIDVMRSCGYSLALKGAGDLHHNQSNFPPKYRVGRSCNLLFFRNE